MKKLSNGMDSTIGNYKKMCKCIFGVDDNSEVIKFLDKKGKESGKGDNEEVIADEGQMIFLLTSIFAQELSKEESKNEL